MASRREASWEDHLRYMYKSLLCCLTLPLLKEYSASLRPTIGEMPKVGIERNEVQFTKRSRWTFVAFVKLS